MYLFPSHDPGGTGYQNSDFEDKNFQVITVPTTSTFTITQASSASATVSTGGSLSIKPFEPVGPRAQSYGYGWGIDTWGTGNWGEAASASNVSLEPGLWSLSNFGEVLIATIGNGKTFTWNAGAASALSNRASTTTSNFQTTNNPTASRVTLISPTTRHLIHLGTETTIGTSSTPTSNFQTTNNPTASRVTLISPTTRHLIHLGTETTIGTSSTPTSNFQTTNNPTASRIVSCLKIRCCC